MFIRKSQADGQNNGTYYIEHWTDRYVIESRSKL